MSSPQNPTGVSEKVKSEYQVSVDMTGIKRNGLPEWFSDFVTGSMPEGGIDLNTSSSWDAPFGGGGQNISNIVQAITGGETTGQLKFFQKHLWQGSDPVEVSLDLEFVTHSDPYDDVVRPSLSLLLMSLPRATKDNGEESWTLKAPVIRGEESISVVGNYFQFPFVIPTDINTDFSDTLCSSPQGGAYPVSCSVGFSFITSEAPTRNNFGFDLATPTGASAITNDGVDPGDFT